jgi:hypothetical protein
MLTTLPSSIADMMLSVVVVYLLTFITSSTVFWGMVSSPGENHGKWLPMLTAATPAGAATSLEACLWA